MTDAKKKRKALLRKPAVQVELALPPPPGPIGPLTLGATKIMK